MHGQLRLLILIAALPAALTTGRPAAPTLPMPDKYVEDYANIIANEHEDALNAILQELEQKTGAQYIVLTVDTTGGLPIEDFAIRLANDQWKLGQKDKDNGLLFVLALTDRTYRFEVGSGLEGVITNQFAAQVGQEVLTPDLRQGNYSRGIYEANLRLVRRIAERENVTLAGIPNVPQQRMNRRPPTPRPNAGPPSFPQQRAGSRLPDRFPSGRTPSFPSQRTNYPRSTHRPGANMLPLVGVCPCCGILLVAFIVLTSLGKIGGQSARMSSGWATSSPLFRGPGYRRRGLFGGGPFGGGFGAFGGSMGGHSSHLGHHAGGHFGGGHFGGGGGGHFKGGGVTGHW